MKLIVLVVLAIVLYTTLAVDLPSLPARKFFIGGRFDYLLNKDGSKFKANNFAYYDSETFGTYGNGTNGEVFKIEIDLCRNVYVAGAFDTVDGVKTGPIAKYSYFSQKWQALGTPNFVSSYGNVVHDLSTDCFNIPDITKKECSCDVYIAGDFQMTIGSTTAQNVAKYDASGSSWDSLGSGDVFTKTARAIYKREEKTVSDADDIVWVGGDMGLMSYQIDKKEWKTITMSTGAVVNSIHYTVVPLFWKTDSLVVAGSFSFSCAESKTCNNIASYDRSSGAFAAMGSSELPVGAINAIDMTKGDAYVGGSFVNGPFSYLAVLKDGATGYTAINQASSYVTGPVKSLKTCGYDDIGCTRGSFAVAGSSATVLKGDYMAFYDANAAQWLPFGNSTEIPDGGRVNVVEFAVTNSAALTRFNLFALMVCVFVTVYMIIQ